MKLKFLFLLLLIAGNIPAQNKLTDYEIGHFFDLNGQMIDGYFDSDYEPKKPMEVHYILNEEFTKGYYYDANKKRVEGYLKFTGVHEDVFFKNNPYEPETRISPDDCQGFVIGKDSFLVVDYVFEKKIGEKAKDSKKKYVRYIDEVGDYSFYKYENSNYTYFFKEKEDSKYIKSFGSGLYDESLTKLEGKKKKEKFKTKAKEVFENFEELQKGIESEKYTLDDIPQMIKLLKYKSKFDKGEKLYLNEYGDEVEEGESYTKYGVIKSVKDSLFYIKYYFKDGTPLCEGGFTSFYPHRKYGPFIWYYPNGKKRKAVNYRDNKPVQVETFFPTGLARHKYIFVDEKPHFVEVLDANGEQLLDEYGRGKEVFQDLTLDREITYEYKFHRVVKSYYENAEQQKIYQLCEQNAKIKSVIITRGEIKEKKIFTENAIQKNAHGLGLVRCVISPKGKVVEAALVKSADSECDNRVLKILFNGYGVIKPLLGFRPGKESGEKITQEIIIPFDLLIKSHSIYRTHYHEYYWNNNLDYIDHWSSPAAFIPRR